MRKVKKCEEDLALAECLIKLGCPLDLSHGYRDTPTGLKLEQNPLSRYKPGALTFGGRIRLHPRHAESQANSISRCESVK